jgi:hypothetical protein
MAQPRSGRNIVSPWGYGLTHCYANGLTVNHRTRRLFTVGGTVTRTAVKDGYGGKMAGSSGYIASENLGSTLSGFDPWTYACLVWFDSITGGVAQSIATMAQSPGHGSAFERSLLLTNAGVFGGYIFDGGAKEVNGTTTVRARTLYSVVLTATGTSGALTLYVNGKQEGSTSVGTAGYSYGSGVQIVLGYGGGTSSQATGPATLTSNAVIPLFLRTTGVGIAHAWNAAKIEMFAQDPWRIFGKPPKRQRFGVTAVGGSFQPAWARGANTVISTGVRAA